MPATFHPPRCMHRGNDTLMRVLVSYVAAILLAQCLAAAFVRGAGPLHGHRAPPTATALAVLTLFAHPRTPPAAPKAGAATQTQTQTQPHHPVHEHKTMERHHHAAADRSLERDAAEQAAADAAALALSAALSLLALQTPRSTADLRSHVQALCATWFWRSLLAHPLYRPPRNT